MSAVAVLVLGSGYVYLAQQNVEPRSEQPVQSSPQPPARPTAQQTADQVRAVRAHLDRQDLTAARTALGNLPAADREAAAMRGLRDEVAKQEARRDSELKVAKECLQKKEWECAVNHALSALTVDRSGDEARQILDRIRNLGFDPARMKAAPAPRPPVVSSPAPSRGTAAPGSGADAASTPAECEATLAAGRRALAARRFDEAIARANDPLAALGFCPGLEKLKQDATRAKNEALR